MAAAMHGVFGRCHVLINPCDSLEAKRPLLHKMYRSDLAVRSLAFSPEGQVG